jgi:hypothetical protein
MDRRPTVEKTITSEFIAVLPIVISCNMDSKTAGAGGLTPSLNVNLPKSKQMANES